MSYAYEHITQAVNNGADAVKDALDLGERDTDLINLVVNAAITCLDNLDADFDQVVTANYEATPSEVRDWWDW